MYDSTQATKHLLWLNVGKNYLQHTKDNSTLCLFGPCCTQAMPSEKYRFYK